ncbi:MAG: hypothetical protein GTN53_19095 [Candidatus Aminicenantes bacterium]|nr:hypothetical protein [Candidatus Aminicenantes bacterium]NIT24608.1 hypothetical protein [Candidatus Aminicenantes bacterium]
MKMKQKSIVLLIVLFLFCSGWFLHSGSSSYSFSGYLPKVDKQNDSLVIKIDTLREQNDFYIYYRTKGLKNYQVRKMKTGKEGNVYYQLSTANLYGDTLEYFIVENGSNVSYSNSNSSSKTITPVFTVTRFTDKESPEIYFQDPGAGANGAASSGSKFQFPVKIGASLSTTAQIHDDSDYPGEKFDATGNIRLYRNIVKEKYQFDFDTNFAYMHHPSETESKVNLSDMKVQLKTGSHSISAGDLFINSTEFTTSSLNRRGLHYEMEGKTLYLGSFFTNSQQKTGFEGFGIPPSDANIFGAAAGVNVGTILKIRGMFITGKDSLDSKTVVSSEEAYREGSIYSVWGELNLFNNHLQLKGEYAHSNFGQGEDSSTIEKESDDAWRAEADFNYGVVTAHMDYKKVGEKFSSIANLFLQNDREGINGNIGLMIKSFSLNLRYRDQKTNINSEVQPMLHSKNIGTDFSWLVANHLQLGGEFSLDNLDYDESTGLLTGSEDMDTIRYAATLGYIAGNNSITFKLGKTESKTFTSNIDGSVSLNLQLGKFLTLNPTLSYQSTENFTDSSTSKIYNAYVNGELTLIPEFFSLSISSSWTRNDNTYSETTTLSAGGNLNLYLSKLFKYKIQPTLSLRAKYEEMDNGSTSNSNVTLYLQADLSF